jgi:hypothetical protein
MLLLIVRIVLLGGVFSLLKGAFKFFHRAQELGFSDSAFYWVLPLAISVGVFKALKVMRPAIKNNILHLQMAINGPDVLRRMPYKLYLFIFSMVGVMAILKTFWSSSLLGNSTLAAVDTAVCAALLVSFVFSFKDFPLSAAHPKPQEPEITAK